MKRSQPGGNKCANDAPPNLRIEHQQEAEKSEIRLLRTHDDGNAFGLCKRNGAIDFVLSLAKGRHYAYEADVYFTAMQLAIDAMP